MASVNRKRSRVSPKTLERYQLEARVYELKLAGATLLEIGTAFGHPNANWAWQAIQRVRRRNELPLVEQEAADNLARIDSLLKAHYPRAIGNPPDEKSSEIVLKCIRQRCAIYGLGSTPLIGELSIGIAQGANGYAGNGGARAIDDTNESVKLCNLEEKRSIAEHLAAIEGILAGARARERGLPGEVPPRS
jgi:hypothetical protein